MHLCAHSIEVVGFYFFYIYVMQQILLCLPLYYMNGLALQLSTAKQQCSSSSERLVLLPKCPSISSQGIHTHSWQGSSRKITAEMRLSDMVVVEISKAERSKR